LPVASRPSPDRWHQIEDLFHQAINCDPADRAAFLEHACGTDSDLRREVESLLASLEETEPFLESAVQNAAEAYIGHQPLSPVTENSYLDHYRIVRLLGSGGMGEVYLAEDMRLKRKVALKLLPSHLTRDPSSLKRFEHEAQLLSALNQANLLTVFEFCHFEGRHFLVTEFVEGVTLREIVGRGRVALDKAIEIAQQTAAALSAAHASGVIHRDIKPENIMVRADGWVKVLDFGIAKLAEQRTVGGPHTTPHATPSTTMGTAVGAVLGTPRYMSPEQARGTDVDARTDLFSLGAVLYEMLTGKAPFRGDTQNDLIADILRSDPPPVRQSVPEVPKRLQTVVNRALAKDRAHRYQSAEALLTDLQHAKDSPRSRLFLPVLAASLIVLLALALFAFRQWLRPAPPLPPRTLAVLPFRNLRPGADTDFLGVSLADEVTAKLGYVKALTVRPSSAINRYRESSSDLHKIATALKTGMLLTGTYLKDGDDLRITARLIGFNPDAVLWQNTLDLKYDKLLTVQDRVARMIIDGLSLRPGSDEQVRLASQAPVDKLAYEYYLRGVDLYSTSNFAAAIAMLEKSVALDPGYAPTWAYLGRAYTTNGSLQFGGRDQYRRAEAAYEKAIALNPVFPEPRVYMANLFTDTGRVEEAVPLLRVALQNSPNDAEAHWELGYAYRYGGMLEESAVECELARRLDPEVKINSSAFNTYLYLGEYDKFLNSIPANDSPLLLFYHGFGSYYKHDYTDALADFDRAYELAPELLPAQVGKALSDALHHNEVHALARLHETERRMNLRGVTDPEAMYKVAQAYAVLGAADDALRMLQRSTVGGFFCYPYVARDPLLNSLRNSPEFVRLLAQAKQRQQQFQQRFSRPGS
jgi:serine/threonine protein kinase